MTACIVFCTKVLWLLHTYPYMLCSCRSHSQVCFFVGPADCLKCHFFHNSWTSVTPSSIFSATPFLFLASSARTEVASATHTSFFADFKVKTWKPSVCFQLLLLYWDLVPSSFAWLVTLSCVAVVLQWMSEKRMAQEVCRGICHWLVGPPLLQKHDDLSLSFFNLDTDLLTASSYHACLPCWWSWYYNVLALRVLPVECLNIFFKTNEKLPGKYWNTKLLHLKAPHYSHVQTLFHLRLWCFAGLIGQRNSMEHGRHL